MEEENKKEEFKYEEPKQKSNKVFVIVIVIIAMALTFGCGIILGQKLFEGNKENKNTSKEDKNTVVDNNDKNDANLSNDIVNKILGYLPVITLRGEGDFSVYQDREVKPSDIDSSIIIANVISFVEKEDNCTEELFQANGICDFVVKTSDIKNEVKKIYGIDNIKLTNEVEGSGLLHCTLVNDVYSCSNSGGGWIGYEYSDYFGIAVNTLFSLDIKDYLKAEKDGNNLYLYEKYANCRFDYIKDDDSYYNNIDNYKFELFRYNNIGEKLVNEVLSGKDFYDTTKTFKEKVFDYLGNNTTQYKHTFKDNNDGTYTWIKTEPIK